MNNYDSNKEKNQNSNLECQECHRGGDSSTLEEVGWGTGTGARAVCENKELGFQGKTGLSVLSSSSLPSPLVK